MRYPSLVDKGFRIVRGGKEYPIPTMRSNYEGASQGRRLGTWDVSNVGPNVGSETGSIATIRARTRDAIRNNPWATMALESYASNLVGTGIMPRWNLPDKTLRDQVQKLWNQWVKECDADGMHDLYGLQGLVAKTVIQGGEALCRFRPRKLSDGLSVPLQLQILEGDFLDDFKNGPTENGSTLHMGVELNSIGRRTRYWIHKQHPGDSFWMPGGFESVPIPATQMLHIYRVDRPGQMRGVPWFASVLARLYLLDQYEDAELDRKKTRALFVAFVKKSGDLAGPGGLIGFDPDTDLKDRPFVDLEPGMLNYLLPGEDVTFADPADGGASYEMFIVRQLQSIAAGIGITYEQLTGDFSKVNFSSSRGRAIEFRRVAKRIISTVMNFQFNQKVAEMWLSMAVASGAIKIPDYAFNRREYTDITWRSDAWEWVNPREDVETEKAKVRAGFKARKSVADELGEDIDEIDRENAERNKVVDRDGLVYDSDPRKTSNAGLTQGRPAGTSNVDPEKFQDADEEPEPSSGGFGNLNEQRNQEAAPADENEEEEAA